MHVCMYVRLSLSFKTAHLHHPRFDVRSVYVIGNVYPVRVSITICATVQSVLKKRKKGEYKTYPNQRTL